MPRLALLGCLLSLLACEALIAPPSRSASPPKNPPVDVDVPCTPGTTSDPIPLRRLTRGEYDNTVRDLLGTTQVRGDRLPPDEKTGLFLSNVSGSVSWSMLEQYGVTAEELTANIGPLRAAVEACDTQALGEPPCAERFVDQFGHRVFRRSLTTEERDRYRALYATHRARGSFDDGLKFVARTMLQSPNFLYHFEEDLASKLAFFIWNSTPDKELLAAAQGGRLANPAAIATQVDRLLADERARSAIGHFHLQLLGVDATTVPNKSPTRYPSFDAAAWRTMVGETASFADQVVRRGDGKLKTLLTGSYSVNAQGQQDQRAGILTQPAVLAGLANPDTTSPVRRGVMIRRNLMCQNLPDPPPDAPTMVPPAMGQETTRQRVTRVTSQSANCGSCHRFINDVGFGLENYGALGEWQTHDNGLPIDASGVLTGTAASNGSFSGARELATRLAGAKELQHCYTKQWVRFALGRSEQARDNCEVLELAGAFAEEDGDVRGLIRRIALSRAFAFNDTGSTLGGTGGGSAGGGTGADAGTGGTTRVLLAVGAQLQPDQSLTTSDGTHRLVYQLDGNLVLYRTSGGAVWSSGTAGTAPGFAAMQGDGNLVVYDAAIVPKFNTMTAGNPGAQLYFETSGRLHIIAPNGTKLWSSP